MSPELRQKLEKFLQPFARDNLLQSFVDTAFSGTEVLDWVQRMNTAQGYVGSLLNVLERFGDIEEGVSSIEHLLLYLRGKLGVNRQDEIDRLLHDLKEEAKEKRAAPEQVIVTDAPRRPRTLPAVPTAKTWLTPANLATGAIIIVLLLVVASIVLPQFQPISEPTQAAISPTTAVALVESPTTVATPTPTDTSEPLNPTQIEQSVTAEMQKIATEAAQTVVANQTATVVMATVWAQQTLYAAETLAAIQRATAAVYTDTPTPDIRKTAEARFTLDAASTQTAQAFLNQTATMQAIIDAYTDTPTVTYTPSKTNTPTITPTSTLAELQTALQRARAGVTSNDQWRTWYPEGFVQTLEGIEMVLVPTGCFQMGNDPDAIDGDKDGGEQCFYESFWISRYEITQAQYRAVMGTNPSTFQGDNRPVETVSWLEAREFAQKIGMELPTEAEWEYAARGPDGLFFPWGNEFVAANVVYDGNSDNETATVGSRPNGRSWVGALDLSGNVWEWTLSAYKDYPYIAGDGREDNLNNNGITRVLRGGSWGGSIQNFARAAYRSSLDPDSRSLSFGFRLVRPVSP